MNLIERLRKYAEQMREEVRQRDLGVVPMDKYRDAMEQAADIAEEAAKEIERLRELSGR